MNFVLFDDERWHSFLPITHTRPVGALRCGIFTMQERWQHICVSPVSFHSQSYLQSHFPLVLSDKNIFINAACFATHELFNAILALKMGEVLLRGNMLLAAYINEQQAKEFTISNCVQQGKTIEYNGSFDSLNHIWEIFSKNDQQLRADFNFISNGRTSEILSPSNTLIGDAIFIEAGAKVEGAILNAKEGPIYIGKNAEIMEGALVRGPFALCENSVLKMGAKIYGATTLGPGCKVGGEVNNAVFLQNANKAHDGFIGNAIIGEWCNLGADTNNSNLKNNYEEVKIWSEAKNTFIKTGLQFCGLIMGDHSKCGINTMFNTGTVVGVSANIFGAGFPRNFIPSFSWGGPQAMMEYKMEKAKATASKVFERRHMTFSDADEKLFQHIYDNTQSQRNF